MRGDETVSAEASSTALAIITETINRNHLNRDDPIQGDPLTDATAAELWVDRARVLHELIGLLGIIRIKKGYVDAGQNLGIGHYEVQKLRIGG